MYLNESILDSAFQYSFLLLILTLLSLGLCSMLSNDPTFDFEVQLSFFEIIFIFDWFSLASSEGVCLLVFSSSGRNEFIFDVQFQTSFLFGIFDVLVFGSYDMLSREPILDVTFQFSL